MFDWDKERKYIHSEVALPTFSGDIDKNASRLTWFTVRPSALWAYNDLQSSRSLERPLVSAEARVVNKIDKVLHVPDPSGRPWSPVLQYCLWYSMAGSGAAAGQTVGPSLHWWALPTKDSNGCWVDRQVCWSEFYPICASTHVSPSTKLEVPRNSCQP